MCNIYLKTYQWLLRCVIEILDLFPPKRIDAEEINMRKGVLPHSFSTKNSIWIHGASLGEIITMRPFVRELASIYGRNRIVCTSTTMDGLKQLRKDELCGLATLLPLELPACSKKFIDRISPQILILSETEIWPLLFSTLSGRKIKYGIVNARINEKTIRRIKLFWPWFSKAVSELSFVLPQFNHYRRRYRFLGVEPHKMQVLGCFKHDIEMPASNNIKDKLKVPKAQKLICLGSTHNNEEDMIIEALSPFLSKQSFTLIIAPRHLSRINDLKKLLTARKIPFSLTSEKVSPAANVLLLDTHGKLGQIYSACDLAFVGGSLVKHGGHNIMEPVHFNVPVITGPYTFNFRYEMLKLRNENAITVVQSAFELQQTIERWLKQPQEFVESAMRATRVLDSLRGCSKKTISYLQQNGFLP